MISLACARSAAIAALVAATACLPGAAVAQGECGATYTVQQGDTLASIAERCGTSVEALAEANAQVSDPARITIGWELAIPGAPASLGPDTEVRPRERSPEAEAALATGTYEVQPGDSFASIATALQVSLQALLATNEGVDPFGLKPGQELRLPSSAAEPAEGAAVDETEDDTGSAEEPADEIEDADASRVGPDEQAAGPDPGAPASAGRLTLQGRVLSGTECAVLETPEGEVYSLVSAEYGLLPGEYVEIEGETVEASLCMQGKATVRVTSLTAIPVPQGG